MNLLDALHTSSSALSAQRVRMNVISSNLANANTTRTPEGGPYRRKEVVMAAYPAQQSFEDILKARLTDRVSEVKVVGIVNDTRPFVSKYDPQHPDANEEGYVLMPNVNIVREMVNMMSATRNYEANVTAINATKSMALKALEIGR
ncbi:MAG: flagellar basal body rod protein FlgC [Deltaproteobacteria bacterium]|nr:flagellar basal body rod protein FlgC [Deltaproteobacteria bacterium]HEN21117.1 flagellar basal body rod protein FlgC [Desulfobacteraceae bacterium]